MPDPAYKLTTWDQQTTHYVALSAIEFQEIKAAKANLLEALFIEEKMDIVIENYLEWENEFLTSSGYFAPFRPVVSLHSGRLFRSIPATHFGAFRPPRCRG